MSKDNKGKNSKIQTDEQQIEDVTLFPEFISSFDQWTTSERQKRNAKHLEEIAEMNFPKKIKRRPEDQSETL